LLRSIRWAAGPVPRELDMSQKPLFETIETEQSEFRNQTLQFYRD
jgi:hypothetical protein